MSCERYENDVVEAALGTAPERALAAHLQSCASCRARLEEERRLVAEMDADLRGALSVEPGPGFERGVRARLAQRRPAPRVAFWLAAAAAVLVAALLVKSLSTPAPRTEPRTAAAPTSAAPTAPTAAPSVPEHTQPAPDRTADAKAVRARARPERRPERSPTIPEVLIAPDESAALARYQEALASRPIHVISISVRHELVPLEVGTLDDLPRPKTFDPLARAEEPPSQDDNHSGGGA